MHTNTVATGTVTTGFRPVRHDRLLQELEHDVYKAKGKLQGIVVCPQCSAVFQAGNWHWGSIPKNAQHEICPACHRQHDHYPAGFVTLDGPFFMAHRDEIMHLVHHHAQRERREHPLQRIMAVEENTENNNGSILVTTTDIHLARGVGSVVHHAYKGELKFHYNSAENLLRVHWTH